MPAQSCDEGKQGFKAEVFIIGQESKKDMSRKAGGNMAEEQKRYKKILIRYLLISAFCAVFYLIYNRFAHEVHSPWMTWLFAWPLVLGAFPAALEYLGILPGTGSGFRNRPEIGGQQKDIYRFGIAALTVASLLKGILKIAGTDSIYAGYLLYAGILMAAGGAVSYFAAIRKSAQ